MKFSTFFKRAVKAGAKQSRATAAKKSSTHRMRNRGVIVQVKFVSFVSDPADHPKRTTYTYEWMLREKPEIGTRFLSRHTSPASPGIIVGLGRGAWKGAVSRIELPSRVATDVDLARAASKAASDEAAWVRMVQRAAGISVRGSVRKTAPDGFPEVPPATGDATSREADGYGRSWWGIVKRLEEIGHDEEEMKLISRIPHRWFAIRDREA